MKRSTRVFAALAVLVAIGMGVALFLVLDDTSGKTAPAATDDVALQPDDNEPDTTNDGSGRRRAHRAGGCSIFGEVRRADGNAPVAQQAVVLIDAKLGETTVTTDSAGAFRFDGIAAGGPYEVRVAAPDMAPARLPGIALDVREKRDVGILLLDAAAPITVRVHSLRDTPIAGARVSAFAAPQTSWNFDWSKAMAQLGQEPVAVAHATTDATGSARFDGLAAGSWSFVASKDGFASAGRTSIRLRAREDADPITLHLSRGYTVAGRVLDDDGQPIPGALVLGATDQNPYDLSAAPLRARAIADEEGRFALTALAAGDIPLWAARPDNVPTPRLVVRVPDVSAIDIVIPTGGTITGVVTDEESGEPLPGVTVQVYGGMGSTQTETDDEGRYQGATAGAGMGMSVTVQKEGYYQVMPQSGMTPLVATRGQTLEHDIQMARGATLTGTVSGPSGPIAGARVMVVRMSPQRGFQQNYATSEADGAYRVTGLEDGEWYVMAMAAGHYTAGIADGGGNWWMAIQSGTAPDETKVEVTRGEEARHDVSLAAGIVLDGRVETDAGDPVAGARVAVFSAMTWGTAPPEGAVSGADGSFRLQGVTPTTQLFVTATKSGLIALPMEPVSITDGAAPDEVLIRMAAPAVVRGTVTLDGGPPPEETYVTVVVSPDQSGGIVNFDPAFYASTQARHPVGQDGTYEVELAARVGQLSVIARAPGHTADTSKPVTLNANESEYTVDLVLGAGLAIEGRAIDARSRAPVGNARVTVTLQAENMSTDHMLHTEMIAFSGAMGGGGGGGGAIVAVTDAAGHFRATGLSEGSYVVSAQADDYVGGSVTARAPTVGTGLELPLSPELEIHGHVTWADGSPVEGVTVSATRENDNGANGGMQPPGFGGTMAPTTDAAGAFVIRGLAEGRYKLTVSNSWQGRVNFLPYDGASVAAGSTDVGIVVRKGLRIAGSIVDDAGEPIAGAWVWAMPMKPEPGKAVTSANVQSDKDGGFELVGLSPSDSGYRLQAHAQNKMGGAAAMPATLENVKAGTTGLRIVMSAGLTLEGVLVDENGDALNNVWLTAMPVSKPGEPGRSSGQAMVGPDGKFKIEGLAAGEYTLTAQSWGNGRAAQLIVNGGEKVVAGASGLRLTASKGATISGFVVNGSGDPVAGASVSARTDGARSANSQSTHDGSFEITGLTEGAVYVVAVSAVGKVGTQQQGVATGTVGLRMVVGDGVECSGRVLGLDSTVITGGALMFQPTDRSAGTRQRGMVKEDGSFVVGGLAEGVEYRVQVIVFSETARDRLDLGTIVGGATGVTLQPVE